MLQRWSRVLPSCLPLLLSSVFSHHCVHTSFTCLSAPPPLSTLLRALTGNADITVKQCRSGHRPLAQGLTGLLDTHQCMLVTKQMELLLKWQHSETCRSSDVGNCSFVDDTLYDFSLFVNWSNLSIWTSEGENDLRYQESLQMWL